VLIAWIDRSDAHHSSVVGTLSELNTDGYVFSLSAVSWTELLSVREVKRRETAEELVRSLGSESVIPVDREVAELAAEFRRSRRSLTTPDALIAATAEAVDAEMLLTTDRKLARVDRARYVGRSRR
jgi:predicted nucleic acid-binding protein